ncbi:MAG TPA: sigma 54-interacting transcriptional regulator [Kofleriaceae bacterium]|nr:sigma 54-interacting transcriptional regulator [Kofleriaceae bacterium]
MASGLRDSIDASTEIPRGPRAAPLEALIPALTIAAHPDPERIGDRLVLDRIAAGREVLLSRGSPEFLGAGRALGAPLADRFVSRTPIRVEPAVGGGIRIACEAGTTIAIGDAEVAGAIDLAPLGPADGVPIVLADRVVLVLHLVERGDDGIGGDPYGMVGRGLGVARLRRAIAQVADLQVPVLIRGETGTGKELVSRALHAGGPRRHGPFVSVNLATIARELAASELFGAVRGAFTGATRDRDGLFRAARGGTLFLDELGEASPEVQASLLRVLETGELYPVGGDTPVTTDVRVIAATDADLDAQIRDGRFKAPLLHRLAGCELRLPPLRERPEDIGLLFHHFAREELVAIGDGDRLAPADPLADPWLPASVMVRLLRYRWPGNIRQLRNVTRQLLIASRGRPQLQLDARLAAELTAGAPEGPAGPGPGTGHILTPEAPAASPGKPSEARRRPAEVAEPELIAALRANAWDLKAAADHLGIPRASIYHVIARCPNVRTAGDLAPAEIERCHREYNGDLDRMSAHLEVSRRALGRRVKELGLEPAAAAQDRPR